MRLPGDQTPEIPERPERLDPATLELLTTVRRAALMVAEAISRYTARVGTPARTSMPRNAHQRRSGGH
jgi:hypothetical protein